MEVGLLPEVGTPYGRLVSVRSLSLVQRLLMLDDLWTAELARTTAEGAVSEDTVAMLTQLVDEMRDGLEQLPDAAYEVRHMLDELRGERFDQALAAIGEASEPRSDPGAMLSDQLPDYEPQSATIAACDYIREKARAESALLDEKLAAIRRGESTPGDFLLPFRCAVHLLGLGTSVAGAILAGGAIGPAALTLVSPGISCIQGWRRDGCRQELPTISFGRR